MSAVDESKSDRAIVISRVVDGPRELVWEAMTNPKHVVNWWGPVGFTTTIEQMDVRVGGTWKHVMRGPDGTEYPNKSIFREVTKPSRLVYTHAGGKKGAVGVNFESTWTFEATEKNQTKVTIRMVFNSAEDRERIAKEYGAIEGGKQTLGRLNGQIAKTPVIVERTYHAPSDVVWKALTDPVEMRKWYFPSIDAFKPEVGFETKATVVHENVEYVHLWKVIEVVPGRKIAYTWKYAGHEGESLLAFELFPEGKVTRLKLTHSGLENFQPEKFPKYARANFTMGWSHFSGSLGDYLDKIVPCNSDFVISRTFDAPRELVWKAWTEPERMARWWGPRLFTNSKCELDVRVGGAYAITMRSPEGTEYPCAGIFLEIVPQEKLVMTLDCAGHPAEWHDQVNPKRDKSKPPQLSMVQTATFEEEGGKTRLTVRSRLESKEIRDSMVKMGMNEGWSQSLDRLAELTAA